MILYTLSLLLSTVVLVGCNNDKYQENEMQEERSEPALGSQQEAKKTNPNTEGRQAGPGDLDQPQIGGYTATPAQTIPENAEANTDLSTFISAVRQAGMINTLNGTGPYTVFAPSNDAFEALPGGTLENLMKPANKQQLVDLLSNHIIAGQLDAAALQNGSNIKTLGNKQLQITKQEDMVRINGAEVEKENIPSSNGVIHVINKVLIPENEE